MIRLVLFDIDGTLITTGGAGVTGFGKALASEFGLENATAGISFAGRTDTGILREVFLKHQIDPSPENFQRFINSYVFWLDHYLHQLNGHLCPNVQETLLQLQSLPKAPVLGLLTGNIRLGAEIKLRHFGLWDLFQVGAFADDHEDRDQISWIAHQRGRSFLKEDIRPAQVLVIGDTPLDIQCGKAIGAKTVAVATGTYTVSQLQACQPDCATESLRKIDLVELVSSKI